MFNSTAGRRVVYIRESLLGGARVVSMCLCQGIWVDVRSFDMCVVTRVHGLSEDVRVLAVAQTCVQVS